MNRVQMATGERVLDLIEALADDLPPDVYRRALVRADELDQLCDDLIDRVADLEIERDETLAELAGCEQALAATEDRV